MDRVALVDELTGINDELYTQAGNTSDERQDELLARRDEINELLGGE